MYGDEAQAAGGRRHLLASYCNSITVTSLLLLLTFVQLWFFGNQHLSLQHDTGTMRTYIA
jgi:hypothetical protein